eukprot:TRINITY_DN3270_c0_g1_i1.p1 TRINITY_DN3270_c0_g1~~TRINITY_DN3270_c0_g1_i1.p1  ORF type:complete len:538 (+),score=101.27 TRINITY_DN3270_c0_g1_i1:131-1744(+)
MYFEIIVGILLIWLAWNYFQITKNYGSFAARGYPEEKAVFPLGSQMFWNIVLRRNSIREYANEYKSKYPNDRFFVAWNLGNPVVVVLDAELAKHVLVKDFESFPIRRGFVEIMDNSNKYFSNMMFNISNVEKWKKVRTTISPVFTSGKLKAMLPYLQESVDRMLDYTLKMDTDMVDSRKYVVRYTTQSIAKAGFGVEADCFNSAVEEPVFVDMVNTITSRKGSKSRQFMFLMAFLCLPNWLVKRIPFSFLDPVSQNFFIAMIKESIENRRKTKSSRGDFVDLVVQEFYKNSQTEEVLEEKDSQFDSDAKIQVTESKKFDDDEMETLLVANVFILLFAGFETTSSMMTIMLVFLAQNPEIQELLYDEIAELINSKNGGDEKLEYNDIMGMKYLDQFIHESLRLFPFLTLERSCVKPYTIPGTDLEVDKGTLFVFPNDAFGLSEEHFSEPEKFEPHHFSEEEKKNRSVYSYLSFGQGPRNCIGMRFALLQIKTCLYRLIYNYKVLRNEKTVDKIFIPPTEFNPDIEGGAWVKFEKRVVA